MMCPTSVYMLYALTLCPFLCSAQTVDTQQFVDTLTAIADDGLGVKFMKDYIAQHVTWAQQPADGGRWASTYAQQISSLMQTRFASVRTLRDRVQALYAQGLMTSSTEYPECCRATVPTEADYQFRGRVNRADICYRKSEFVTSGEALLFPPAQLLQHFKENLADVPGLKWQYFGTEQGLLFNYPSQKAEDCGKYDPRFRPWYIQTATPSPKDVVIVIDQSGSMRDRVTADGRVTSAGAGLPSLMEIAQEASSTLIDTFNPMDRIGVVGFSTRAYFPPGTAAVGDDCFSRELALATPQTKALLKQFVGNMTPLSSTYYSRGLEGAFTLLDGAQDGAQDGLNVTRRRVVLFLTDGRPSDSTLAVTRIRDYNQANPSRQVTVFTFGIGNVDQSILSRMATEHQTNPGEAYTIANIHELRKYMASYYSHFMQPELNDPVVSLPYYDAFGLGTGMVLTVSLPVYSASSFVGVVGVDLSLTEIVASALFADNALVVDVQTSYLLAHPLLPRPYSVTDDPVYVRLASLDDTTGARQMLQSLKRGAAGTVVAQRTAYTSRGEYFRGPLRVHVSTAYHWAPVAGTSLGVCIMRDGADASASTVRVASISTPDVSTSSVPFTYHLENVTSGATQQICRHFLRKAIKGTTVVKFGPEAFVSPFEYLDTVESPAQIASYRTDIQAQTGGILKLEAIRDVYLTSKVHSIWFSTQSWSEKQYSIWRYIATPHSVIRVAPGISLHKNYDPVQRPWYKKAVALAGQVAVSSPYLDAFGAGYVITLSQALYASSGSDASLAVVMGMDVPVTYFHSLLQSSVTACQSLKKCLVLDDQGYLVLHPQFITFDDEEPTVEDAHVTTMEKSLPGLLVNPGYMQEANCYQMDTLNSLRYYEMSRQSVPTGGSLQMEPLPGTNLQLVQLEDVSLTSCHCMSGYLSVPLSCVAACDCQCYSRFPFQYCRNQLPTTGTQAPCVPPAAKINMTVDVQREAALTESLPRCYDPRCTTHKQASACLAVAGCNWCSQTRQGAPLSSPHCDYMEECHFGRVGYKSPYSDTSAPPDGAPSQTVVIVVAVVVPVIVVIIIASIAAACLNKGTKSAAASTHNSVRPTPRAPPPRHPQAAHTAPPGARVSTVTSQYQAPPGGGGAFTYNQYPGGAATYPPPGPASAPYPPIQGAAPYPPLQPAPYPPPQAAPYPPPQAAFPPQGNQPTTMGEGTNPQKPLAPLTSYPTPSAPSAEITAPPPPPSYGEAMGEMGYSKP